MNNKEIKETPVKNSMEKLQAIYNTIDYELLQGCIFINNYVILRDNFYNYLKQDNIEAYNLLCNLSYIKLEKAFIRNCKKHYNNYFKYFIESIIRLYNKEYYNNKEVNKYLRTLSKELNKNCMINRKKLNI